MYNICKHSTAYDMLRSSGIGGRRSGSRLLRGGLDKSRHRDPLPY